MLKGVMINKDVTHPRMRRLIKEPRIILLDCSLEYKKGESQVAHTSPQTRNRAHIHSVNWTPSNTGICVCVCQTDIEISKEEDFAKILQMEEDYIQQICDDIIRLKPDLVFTEKGISGQHTHSHTPLLSDSLSDSLTDSLIDLLSDSPSGLMTRSL